MRRLSLQGVSAAVLALLTPRAATAQPGVVWLRVRNDSDQTFEHVWQGLPRHASDTDLGPLHPGQTSRWHAVPAVLAHYRKTRVQLAHRHLTHVLDATHLHGQPALPPGRYTFALRLAHGQLVLTLTGEEPVGAGK